MDRKAQIAAQRRRWDLAKAVGLPVYSEVLDASDYLDAANVGQPISGSFLGCVANEAGLDLLAQMQKAGL